MKGRRRKRKSGFGIPQAKRMPSYFKRGNRIRSDLSYTGHRVKEGATTVAHGGFEWMRNAMRSIKESRDGDEEE